MTQIARTFAAVLDTFQRKEGIWNATFRLSYHQLATALQEARVSFAEWDPERGLYYLDFSSLEAESPTLDLVLLDFHGPLGTDHFRFEWTQAGGLGGIELQTHAPGPLPLLPEIAEWIEPGSNHPADLLTHEAWEQYLSDLHPLNPLL